MGPETLADSGSVFQKVDPVARRDHPHGLGQPVGVEDEGVAAAHGRMMPM